jgi:hypothetical protein
MLSSMKIIRMILVDFIVETPCPESPNAKCVEETALLAVALAGHR